ncbi:MAG: hypothetical protein ACXVYB_00205 [Arthrobacter sp.]
MESKEYEPEVSDWVQGLMDKRETLAKTLMDIAYGDGKWDECVQSGMEDELMSNYRKDAWDILMASRQLLGIEAEENLKAMDLLRPWRYEEGDA